MSHSIPVNIDKILSFILYFTRDLTPTQSREITYRNFENKSVGAVDHLQFRMKSDGPGH